MFIFFDFLYISCIPGWSRTTNNQIRSLTQYPFCHRDVKFKCPRQVTILRLPVKSRKLYH